MIWGIIAIAFMISLLLRTLPLAFSKARFIDHPLFLAFLDYAACAVIGCMIYLTSFPNAHIVSSVYKPPLLFTANALILALAFCIGLRLRKPVVTFIVCLIMYMLILLFIKN